jgi:hypothetical protein
LSLENITKMDKHQNYNEIEIDNESDIELNKPSKSRFLFVLFFLGIFIFSWAGCYQLHQLGYEKNDDMKFQESTLFEPKYK